MNKQKLLAIKKQLDRERLPKDLKYFFKEAWKVLEPGKDLRWNFHLDAIIEHLQEMAKTEPAFHKLIVSLPPGFSKSLLISVCLHPWLWLNDPGERIMTASYSAALAIRDSLKSRNIIQSDWYQELFCSGDEALFTISRDQNQKQFLQNVKYGFRLAVSVGGSVSGQRAQWLIIDDPTPLDDWANTLVLNETWNWYKDVWSSRRADPATTREIIIMQRLNHNDLTGHLLNEVGGFEHLRLPMRYDERIATPTVLGKFDTRTKKGALLDPVRFPESYVRSEEKKLGRYSTSAQFQQNPLAGIESEMFDYEYFPLWIDGNSSVTNDEYYDLETESNRIVRLDVVTLPKEFDSVIQSWDFSFGEGKQKKTTSQVAGHVYGVKGETFYLLYREFSRMSFPEMLESFKRVSNKFPSSRRKLVEAKANGPAIIQSLRSSISGIKGIHPKESKLARAHSALPIAESYNIVLPHPKVYAKTPDLLENLVLFPNGPSDDDMDAMTQCINFHLTHVKITIS